jgi:tRNA pseudouridine55 synthase
MVSAVKIAGVPLYKMARKGQEIERKPRLIHIYSFQLLDFTLPRASFVLRCTKGTYVRTICHDIGERLGVGAHLEQLRRTESGGFTVAQAITLDALLQHETLQLMNVVIPMHTLVGTAPEG